MAASLVHSVARLAFWRWACEIISSTIEVRSDIFLTRRFGSQRLALLLLICASCFCSGFSCRRTRTPARVEYRNEAYGFSLRLPASWRGFKVQESQWEARSLVNGEDIGVVATGPRLSIIHPKSTPEKPRQDIPIMVFTQSQWGHLQREEWSVSAAPIPPASWDATAVTSLPCRRAITTPFPRVGRRLSGSSKAGR